MSRPTVSITEGRNSANPVETHAARSMLLHAFAVPHRGVEANLAAQKKGDPPASVLARVREQLGRGAGAWPNLPALRVSTPDRLETEVQSPLLWSPRAGTRVDGHRRCTSTGDSSPQSLA